MLNDDLERVWKRTAESERKVAKAWAGTILANLVHYPITKRQHYDTDVEQIAASLIAFRVERNNKL